MAEVIDLASKSAAMNVVGLLETTNYRDYVTVAYLSVSLEPHTPKCEVFLIFPDLVTDRGLTTTFTSNLT